MHICIPCKDGYRIEFVKGGRGGGGGGGGDTGVSIFPLFLCEP